MILLGARAIIGVEIADCRHADAGVMRQVAGEMGYSEVGQTPTQTQKTPSL